MVCLFILSSIPNLEVNKFNTYTWKFSKLLEIWILLRLKVQTTFLVLKLKAWWHLKKYKANNKDNKIILSFQRNFKKTPTKQQSFVNNDNLQHKIL